MTEVQTSLLQQYAASHQHPVNRWCHHVGIPLIVSASPLLLAGLWHPAFFIASAATFCLGWALQFLGHWFEGQPPEFLRNWRFLFVGVRWWLLEMRGTSPVEASAEDHSNRDQSSHRQPSCGYAIQPSIPKQTDTA
jgi:uncharacterized membrane protein YGL010W